MRIRQNYLRLRSIRGFTLIEMAIVLGVVGVLGAGLFRLLSTSNQQSKDLATAQQHLQIINAVEGYLASNYGQSWMGSKGANTAFNLPLPSTTYSTSTACYADGNWGGNSNLQHFCDYLPLTVYSGLTNPYGQSYIIHVLKDSQVTGTPPLTYSFMVLTTGGNTIPDPDGGRISALIGGDGGFIYTSAVCTASASTTVACGTMGAWQTDITTTGANGGYQYASSRGVPGIIASRTFVVTGISNGSTWLSRTVLDAANNYSYNTMSTSMFMGAPSSGSYDLYMYPDTVYPASPSTGAQGANNIHLYNGALIVEGTGGVSFTSAGAIDLGSTAAIIGTAGGVGPLVNLAATPAYAKLATADTIITLTGGCSYLTLASTATCAPAFQITSGDMAVSGYIFGTKLLSTSDVRLKTNIHPIKDALANLMKIDAVAFTLKDSGAKGMGVTAQNLEEVYPELVSQTSDHKYVDYNGLIGPLIGAVQELKRQNDDLREQLHQQQVREENLEATIKLKKIEP